MFDIVVTIDAVAMRSAHGPPGQALAIQLETSTLFAIAAFDGRIIHILGSSGGPCAGRMATMADAADDGCCRFLFGRSGSGPP